MHVERYGQGEHCIVALHGWAGSHRDFFPLVRHSPSDLRWIVPDLPGHGASPPPPGWSEDEIVSELVPLLSEFAPATLLGFCSGAVLALLLADRSPTQITRIVMIDPFAYLPWYFRLFLAGRAGRLAYRLTFGNAWSRALVSGIIRLQQNAREDFTAAFEHIDLEIALRWLQFFSRVGPPQRFAHLKIPIDLVYGDRTFRAVRTSVQLYRATWPQLRVHRLDGLGHLPLVRGSAKIARIISDPYGVSGPMPKPRD